MLKLQPGQTASFDLGRLTVRVDRHHDGVSFTVDHHRDLNKTFTDLDEAAAYYRYLRDNGHRPVRDIVAEAGVLISASAVLAEAAAHLPAPATLDAYRHQGRPVRNTRTHTFRRPLSAAMLRLIRQHTNGLVTLDGRASWLSLRAIEDRGYGTAIFKPGTRIIEAIRLNTRGLELAGQAVAA